MNPSENGDGATLREIGESLGISAEGARLVERTALHKVEAALLERLGPEAFEALRLPKRQS